VFVELIIRIFNTLKEIYFKLFGFIVGNEKRKFYRFFAHMATVMSLFLILVMLIHAMAQIFIGDGFTEEHISFFVSLTVAAVLSPCMAKFLIFISRWI